MQCYGFTDNKIIPTFHFVVHHTASLVETRLAGCKESSTITSHIRPGILSENQDGQILKMVQKILELVVASSLIVDDHESFDEGIERKKAWLRVFGT